MYAIFFLVIRKNTTHTSIATANNKLISTSSLIKASKKNSSSPIMIVHIGPRKTGTSTIQLLLEKSKEDLKVNSFIYIDKEDVCIREYFYKGECERIETKSFENKLQRLHSSNKNVILSSERLPRSVRDDNDFRFLLNKLRNWDIRIVATYRRYFDWLLSEYTQECNLRAKRAVTLGVTSAS